MFEIVSSAYRLISARSRSRWLLLVVVAVVASFLELAGAVLIFVLLGLVANPSGDIDLPIVGDLRSWFPGVDDETLLLGLAAGMAVFFVIRPAVHLFKTYAENRIAHNFGARLSADLARGYLAMPYAFHLGRNSSTLIRNSFQAVSELVAQIYLPVVKIVAESIMVLTMLVLLVVLAPLATLLAVILLGGAALILAVIVQPRMKRLGKRSHALQKSTLSVLQQSLHGIRDIKILGRDRAFADEYETGRIQLSRTKYLRATASALPRDILETVLTLFILGFFAVSIVGTTDPQSVLSVLGLFAYAGLRLQPAMQHIVSGINNLKFASAPLDDIAADMRLIQDYRRPRDDGHLLPLTERWAVESASFHYGGSDRPALRRIDLDVTPGEVIGICGPTGGGKTTLVDLMTGLLEPTEGRVSVDGHDLREHDRAWHRNLGIVPQMIFLTDDTLRRNIALGVPEKEIDDDAVAEAVELAQLRTFIADLPDGLETKVGERGVRVSGGQRQRVAIARALYRRPQVLIFDEGTSALDNQTEAELMRALERLRGDHTIVMVAHRLSTVRNCDRIAFVQEGRLAGYGTYDELEASSEGFRRLTASM
ncbi:MAG: ABC transporter ATP-binding protein [Nitriliruptoraceae bacterium]|nr:ABC transporter ATP-binding protein [Nitriliruptoraceae bacterium]